MKKIYIVIGVIILVLIITVLVIFLYNNDSKNPTIPPHIPKYTQLNIGGNPAVKLYGKNTTNIPVKNYDECVVKAIEKNAPAYNYYQLQSDRVCTLFSDDKLCFDGVGQEFFNFAFLRSDILPPKKCSVNITKKTGKLLGDGGITLENITDATDCAITSETMGNKGWTWDNQFSTCTSYPIASNMCTFPSEHYVYNTDENVNICTRTSKDIDNAVFSAFSGVGTQTSGDDITEKSCREKALGDPDAVAWTYTAKNKVCDISYSTPDLCYLIDKTANVKSGIIMPVTKEPQVCPSPTCKPSHIYTGEKTCDSKIGLQNCTDFPLDDIRNNILPYKCVNNKCTYAPLVDYGGKYTIKEITAGCTEANGKECTVGSVKGKCGAFQIDDTHLGPPQCIPDNFCLTAKIPFSYNGGNSTMVNSDKFPYIKK